MVSALGLLTICIQFLLAASRVVNQHATIKLRAAHVHSVATRNTSSHSLSPSELQDQYGDITCMRQTGGICTLFDCDAKRGTTMCIKNGAGVGKCKCAQGLCATAAGACEAQDGEWKGVYSVKFANPSARESAYLSATPFPIGYGYKAIRSTDSEPMWKLAFLENKHVRLESVQYPGHYLSLSSTDAGLIAKLEKLEGVLAAAQVTFVVQETRRNGGGLQFWSPVHQVALSPSSLTSAGVTVCDARVDGSQGVSQAPFACTGKEFVQFTPALPNEVVSTKGTRVAVSIISPLNSWQKAVVLAVLSVCCFGSCFFPFWFYKAPESSDAAS